MPPGWARSRGSRCDSPHPPALQVIAHEAKTYAHSHHSKEPVPTAAKFNYQEVQRCAPARHALRARRPARCPRSSRSRARARVGQEDGADEFFLPYAWKIVMENTDFHDSVALPPPDEPDSAGGDAPPAHAPSEGGAGGDGHDVEAGRPMDAVRGPRRPLCVLTLPTRRMCRAPTRSSCPAAVAAALRSSRQLHARWRSARA